MRHSMLAAVAAVLGAAAATGSADAAGYTLLKYSDTDFAKDMVRWTFFTPFMDPDNLPTRPEDASLFISVDFYVAPVEGYYEIRDGKDDAFLWVEGADYSFSPYWPFSNKYGGYFSLSFSVDATGQIHSAAFSGFVYLSSDEFSWSSSGRYSSFYEYCDVTWVYGDPGDCVHDAGESYETHGTWSIISSTPPPPPPPPAAIPLPATSTLLLSGMLFAASGRLVRRRRR